MSLIVKTPGCKQNYEIASNCHEIQFLFMSVDQRPKTLIKAGRFVVLRVIPLILFKEAKQ